VEAGEKTAHEVAHDRVQEILAKATPVELPPGADAELERVLAEVLEETGG
jgi:hypothetical protein